MRSSPTSRSATARFSPRPSTRTSCKKRCLASTRRRRRRRRRLPRSQPAVGRAPPTLSRPTLFTPLPSSSPRSAPCPQASSPRVDRVRRQAPSPKGSAQSSAVATRHPPLFSVLRTIKPTQRESQAAQRSQTAPQNDTRLISAHFAARPTCKLFQRSYVSIKNKILNFLRRTRYN